ncbi:hypothetical protein H072_3626 [Dactylellina haptotyla CBS 200.50]|uniref:Uncharacterized protein n=1 Tax=Dactylellina haptotyla (strain CBS 200.50) TaxID=1284197 RepID=S8AMW3_DACHA|nr:hypothetical protein H072_3626 [Dactylellina haptotyla CBS 200.50]
MKLDSSKPGALSFKVLEAGQEEIRPPLTPATEVDLQKSCAILVQSTGYSKSFSQAVGSTQRRPHARQEGAVPVRSHNRTPSKSGNRTPVGRVSKSHRRTGSAVRFEKTSTSKYVPPRRPAPEKSVPVARHGKKNRDEKKLPKEDELKIPEEREPNKRVEMELAAPLEKKSTEKERKSSDVHSGEESEKNRKGVKKLVVAVTGYLRPQDTTSSPPSAESEPSPDRKDKVPQELSPTVSTEKTKRTTEPTRTRPSRRIETTTYVEAYPEHLNKSGSDEEKKTADPHMKRSVSKRLGHAMKDYVKPPYVDRFTPEPLNTSTSKEELRKPEKKRTTNKPPTKLQAKPSPIDVSTINVIEEEEPSAKPTKTPKSAKSLPERLPKTEKSPIERPSPDKEIPKSTTEAKTKTSGTNGHHNPFRLLHNYVKPSMAESLPPLQTNLPQGTANLSPPLPSERRPLTPQKSQPSMTYVPPKIRPRGKTLPGSEVPTSNDTSTASAPTRQGPIFGGGYPVKQEASVALSPKDKENRGPSSPGFFGRNANGSGFRIHFSHFLHKQRGDGYDQLE